MTMNTLEYLQSIQACPPAIDWVAAQPDQSPRALWLACLRGEWALWMAAELGVEIPDAAHRPSLLRLLREYAPRELRAAGLEAEAARLEALPDDVSWAAVKVAGVSWAARADAAWAVSWAARAVAKRAPDPEAEHARCADEVRAAMGDAVVVAWERELEAGR